MKADYITFRKAANASAQGLVIQAVLAGLLLAYAVVSRDHAALSMTIFLAVGAGAWLALWIVYDQHRRERVEAIEVDALNASGAGGSSVFESQEDFRPAARRLAFLHKFFMPGVSLVIAGVLIGTGIWRYISAGERIAPDQFTGSIHKGWGLSAGILCAVLGFIVARYAAGMAKQTPWANLRGGASYAVGMALLGLALAIGHFVHFVGPDTVSRYLQRAIPIFMILIGAEVILHFVLSVYRPRATGEIPRPAFDSRLLGFAAAPDRIAKSISDAINYQLGFDATSGWFYQLLSKWFGVFVCVALLVTWLMSCFAVLKPHQRGMILRFGRPVQKDIGPGLHLKAPWPIDRLYIPEFVTRDAKGRASVSDLTVTGVRTIQLGSAPPATTEPILWTNDHLGDEVFQFVRSGSLAGSDMGSGELADLAMISAEIPLQYVVEDVERFDRLAPPAHRDDVLRAVAKREVRRFFQTVSLDDVLGDQRVVISAKLQKQIQNAFDEIKVSESATLGAGVRVVWLGLAGVHPPKETASAFEKPIEADQRREARLESARAEAVRRLTSIAGSVEKARAIIAKIEERDALANTRRDAAQVASLETKIATLETEIAQMISAAGGSSAAMLSDARAKRWETHMRARGDASRYEGQLSLFEAAPELYRFRRYYQALSAAMKNSRVYIADERIPELRLDVLLHDKELGIDAFKSMTETQSQ